MSVFIDPVEASQRLAKAAAAVVYAPDVGGLGDVIDQLHEALQHYELCRMVTPVPEYRPTRWSCSCVGAGVVGCPDHLTIRAKPRFRAALATVDWRAQNPVGLAQLLIAICVEVTGEQEIPNHDSAVGLIAGKLASVCGISVDDDQVAAKICECSRRSKRRDKRTSLTT